MATRSWEPLGEGDYISAEEYNRLVREVERLSNLVPAEPIEIEPHYFGQLISLNLDGLPYATIGPGPLSLPPQYITLTANTNNLVVTSTDVIITNNTTDISVTGFVPTTDGQILTVTNSPTSTFTLSIPNLSTSSLPANRVGTPQQLTAVLQPSQSITLTYSTKRGQWLTVSLTAPNGFPVTTITGTTYTVKPSDIFTLLLFTNNGSITVTLPTPGTTGIPPGVWFTITNASTSGTITFTVTGGGTIFSLTPATLIASQTITLTPANDGSNYRNFYGNQPVVEAQLTFTDVTTANSSTTKHGLVPKLPNDATKFYDGTGAFSKPTSADPATNNVTVATGTGTLGNSFASLPDPMNGLTANSGTYQSSLTLGWNLPLDTMSMAASITLRLQNTAGAGTTIGTVPTSNNINNTGSLLGSSTGTFIFTWNGTDAIRWQVSGAANGSGTFGSFTASSMVTVQLA